uniref:Serum response factor homolog n=1 Tax=Artemia sinica TaxID=112780 RepID=A0A650ATY1_9CRUS|nr:serum response factor-like protein [Artemia sinica]
MQNQSPVETRYTMNYGGLEPDIYGYHASSDSYMNAVLQQHVGHSNLGHSLNLNVHHGLKRTSENVKQEPLNMNLQDPPTGLDLGVSHGSLSPDEDRSGPPSKKTPPANGKKTKGRVKIKMEFIDNKLRRYTTFSKRKTGIMKKAYELSTLTGTQVMLLVASETGHVYTFATRKLQPMITSEAGKALIQTCLNSPDPPNGSGDQRMSATGFEETELTYNVQDDDQKMFMSEISEDNDDGDNDEGDDGEGLGDIKYSPDSSPSEQCNSPENLRLRTTQTGPAISETALNRLLAQRKQRKPSKSKK